MDIEFLDHLDIDSSKEELLLAKQLLLRQFGPDLLIIEERFIKHAIFYIGKNYEKLSDKNILARLLELGVCSSDPMIPVWVGTILIYINYQLYGEVFGGTDGNIQASTD